MKRYFLRLLRILCKFDWTRNRLISRYNQNTTNPALVTNELANIEFDERAIVEDLRASGFSRTFNMDPVCVRELIEDCERHPTRPLGGSDEHYISYANPVNPDGNYLWYMYHDIKEWESTRKVLLNSNVVEVAKAYLGNNPIIQNVYAWWSFPKPEQSRSRRYNFHYDIDNYKFVKMFTYLTDVDLDSGPHQIIRGSHRSKKLVHKLNRVLSDDQVSRYFPASDLVNMTGEKGTSFFEDTYAYHNGKPPRKPRLIFQIEFALSPHFMG